MSLIRSWMLIQFLNDPLVAQCHWKILGRRSERVLRADTRAMLEQEPHDIECALRYRIMKRCISVLADRVDLRAGMQQQFDLSR